MLWISVVVHVAMVVGSARVIVTLIQTGARAARLSGKDGLTNVFKLLLFPQIIYIKTRNSQIIAGLRLASFNILFILMKTIV